MPETVAERVLLVHNYYRQPGGEDQVFEAEAALLEERGHRVIRYVVHNDAVDGMRPIRLARATFWNDHTYDELRQLIARERPDVLHAHNTFPLISPAAYTAAHDVSVPVVQTLHNYRLLCAGATHFRNGRTCQACVGTRTMWPALVGRCYRGSLPATAVTVGMLQYHRARRTWRESVDLYLVMTGDARERFIAGGLPAERVMVKPHFVAHPARQRTGAGDYAMFVGRLDEVKGVRTLLAAWAVTPDLPRLVIVGDGPLGPEVAAAAANDRRIEWRGWQSREEVKAGLEQAAFLVFPSECLEGFGLVIIEAFAAGVPVVAADLGAARSLVEHEVNGLRFPVGDSRALAAAAGRLWAGRAAEGAAMGERARAVYVAKYTADANYNLLSEAYALAAQIRDAASVAGGSAAR